MSPSPLSPGPLKGALLLLVFTMLAAVAIEAGDWMIHGEDRREMSALRRELVTAGHRLIVERARADTLRQVIESYDQDLASRVEELDRFGRRASDGMLPHHLFPAYSAVLEEYRAEVEERNRLYEEWTAVHARYQAASELYRTLADRLLRTAARVGEDYPSVPSPAEAYAEVLEARQRTR